MVQSRYTCIRVVMLLFFVAVQSAVAAIIHVPEDVPSIQEAVEMANSGDEIHVNQHGAFFLKEQNVESPFDIQGIRVVNKDLTLVGTTQERTQVFGSTQPLAYSGMSGNEIPPESNSNFLVLENSTVVIHNLKIQSPSINYPPIYSFPYGITVSPIQVVSGKLTLNNVELTGIIKAESDLEIIDSTIFGYSRYRDTDLSRFLDTHPIPALHIRNQNSSTMVIENSAIVCDVNDAQNRTQGGRPVVIEDVNNSSIKITNSTISTGGHRHWNLDNEKSDSYWNYYNFETGLAGILIAECDSLELDFRHSVSTGGSGSGLLQSTNYYPGGPGIKIMNSNNIDIRKGSSFGSPGVRGVNLFLGGQPIHSSDGGNGMEVFNSSVKLIDVELIPGMGGPGRPDDGVLPGEDGVEIWLDENSTLIQTSDAEHWSLYN